MLALPQPSPIRPHLISGHSFVSHNKHPTHRLNSLGVEELLNWMFSIQGAYNKILEAESFFAKAKPLSSNTKKKQCIESKQIEKKETITEKASKLVRNIFKETSEAIQPQQEPISPQETKTPSISLEAGPAYTSSFINTTIKETKTSKGEPISLNNLLNGASLKAETLIYQHSPKEFFTELKKSLEKDHIDLNKESLQNRSILSIVYHIFKGLYIDPFETLNLKVIDQLADFFLSTTRTSNYEKEKLIHLLALNITEVSTKHSLKQKFALLTLVFKLNGNLELIKKLLEHLDKEITSNELSPSCKYSIEFSLNSQIEWATHHNDLDLLKYMIETNGSWQEFFDETTLLLIAKDSAKYGHSEIYQWLLRWISIQIDQAHINQVLNQVSHLLNRQQENPDQNQLVTPPLSEIESNLNTLLNNVIQQIAIGAISGQQIEIFEATLEEFDYQTFFTESTIKEILAYASTHGLEDVLIRFAQIESWREYFDDQILLNAARNGHFHIFKFLVNQENWIESFSLEQLRQMTPFAAYGGQIELLKAIFDNPGFTASLNSIDIQRIVEDATINGQTATLQWILENIDSESFNLETINLIASTAAQYGHLDILIVLLEHPHLEAFFDCTTVEQITQSATTYDQLTVLKWILKQDQFKRFATLDLLESLSAKAKAKNHFYISNWLNQYKENLKQK